MRALVLSALFLFPASAVAADSGSGEFSLVAGFFQMLGSLALVLGLIFLFYHLSSKWLKIAPAGKGVARYIRVVESRFLAPKKSLMLVEVGGEYLLLSNCGDRLQLVKQIDMVEEIEVVEERRDVAQFSAQMRERLAAIKEGVPGLMRLAALPKKRSEAL
ncbi:FliO/MopB family protein [Geotalea toluenoxydans]|uniref:FliO/MopB family protein n=1 Tax=Geotalea toluenoxydans TaxID=421624 RepID=UPI0006CF2B98|nr:flagellar biosynthetic protein FliO [Geotalea toluenoxydans]